ncbi:MAG: hypothetical protein AB7O57_06700 [Hyphomicrobiaceae bacterium]
MSDTLEPLIRDLVLWCAAAPRTYAEALDAWRTSCPRLMVWEEAQARGLLETRPGPAGLTVVVTRSGRRLAARASARRASSLVAPPAALPPDYRSPDRSRAPLIRS